MPANYNDFVASTYVRYVRDKTKSIQQKINRTNCQKTNLDTEDGAMPLIPTLLRQPLQAFLLIVIAAVLGGCAITLQQPAENATVTLPSKTKVVVTGNASYSGLKVTIDGIDVSNQLASVGTNRDEGDVSVAVGTHLITATAEVYCWYCTGSKTLSTDTNNFTVVANAFIDIEAGESHTCAVAADNRAYCWGDNTHGQLGTGALPDLTCTLNTLQPSRPCQLTPVEVSGGLRFKSVSAGEGHSCGITTAGEVYCWGKNHRGQLGNGSIVASRTPVKVPHGHTFKAVSAGGNHACAIDDQNWLFCWGDNGRGQLGAMGLTGCPTGTPSQCSTTPVRQGTGTSWGSLLFYEVSAGAMHTCASNHVDIKCWGDNANGQLGNGQSGAGTGGANAGLTLSGFTSYATPAGSTLGAGLSAGVFHTCAFRPTGSGAACWGANNSGQLGGGWPQSSASSPMPVAAPGAVGSLTRGISAGTLHTCALFQSSTSGNIVPVCAGYNSDGQLGNGSQTTSNTFVRVSLSNPNQDFFKVSVGGRHSCALNITGRLTSTPGGTDFSGSAFCWGDNSFGQVGQAFQQTWTSPTLVHQP